MQRSPSRPIGGEDCLCADIGDRVFFDFESARLRPDALATLVKQAGWLNKYPHANILLAGNSDERGIEEYDLALGYQRANAARAFLEAKGVAATRIFVLSFGKSRTTATGNNEQAWAQNRTAVTSVR